MPTACARATCSLALALILTSCIEVEVRRTVNADLSGRESVVLRVPKGVPDAARAEAFPGSLTGATAQPTRTEALANATAYRTEIAFADVARVQHQVEFLTSTASVQTAADGTRRYRETLANSYLRGLARAPSAESRQALAAEMDRTKASLAGARLTYTVLFPGPVLHSNAAQISGNQATWTFTADQLFAQRTVDLTAEFRVGTLPPVAAGPAGSALLAAEDKKEEPKKDAPPAEKKEEPKKDEAKKEEAPPAEKKEEAKKEEAPPAEKKEEAKKEEAPPEKKEEGKKEEAKKGVAKKEEAEPEKKEEAKKETPEVLVPPPKTVVSLEPQPTDDESSKAVKKFFSDALLQIEQRHYKQAAEILQKAIAAKPNSRLVADLYQDTVAKFREQALVSNDPELKAAGQELQKIALRGRIEQLRDPTRVKKLIGDLNGPFLIRTLSMEELSIAGDYAVPQLMKFLQENQDAELRSRAAYVLGRLKGVAVPAVCECLKCPDPMIRQIIIQSLETIKDPRSIPYLLWLAQDPKSHPLVALESRRLAVKIAGGDSRVLQTTASEAFLQQAEDYYHQNPKVLLPHFYEYLVWRWDYEASELRSESVPRHLYPYRMAEEISRNALLANPEFDPAVPTLICAYFAQKNLLESFFIAIEGRKLNEEEQKEAEFAKPIRERLKVAPLAADAAGKRFAYAALRRALRGSDELGISVSLSCIDTVRAVSDASPLPKPPMTEEEAKKARRGAKKEGPAPGPRRPMTWFGPKDKEEAPPPPPSANPFAIPLDGSPLVDALSYPDKRIRYAAAEAIVALAPTFTIRDGDRVMANLSQALSETAVRVALLVDEDEAGAEQLRPLLQDVGIAPTLARTQRDALNQALDIPPKDLIILSGQLKKIDPVEMLASLRQIYTLAAVPVIVVSSASDRPKLTERFAKENAVFLTTPFDAQTVRTAVEDALKKSPEPKNEMIAARHASVAAETLANVITTTSVFKLEDAMPALLRTVVTTTQPDLVRIPCAKALRRLATPRALPYLAEAYNDSKTSKNLRLAILEALGACAANVTDLPKAASDILKKASYDDDFDIRKAAALGIGLHGGAGADYVRTIDFLLGNKPPAPAVAPAPEKKPDVKEEKAPPAPEKKGEAKEDKAPPAPEKKAEAKEDKAEPKEDKAPPAPKGEVKEDKAPAVLKGEPKKE